MKMFFRVGDDSVFSIEGEHVPMPGDRVDVWNGQKFVPYTVESRRWISGGVLDPVTGHQGFTDVTIYCRRSKSEEAK